MDKSTIQILDTLTSNLDSSLSINQLTQKIKENYGAAYYANIYNKLQTLKKRELLTIDQMGRSSIIKLNFQNHFLIDFLAEMEIEKKIGFFKKNAELIPLLNELEKSLDDMCSIQSISSIEPERNIKLNRIELLFLLRKVAHHHSETLTLYTKMRKLQNKHNIRIDCLILDENTFSDLARSTEINPLQEALSQMLNLFCPQSFWREIRKLKENTEIRTIQTETKPAKISGSDLIYNLNRFGYKEFGWTIKQGKEICIEYLTTALLLQNDVRYLEAAPIILSKNVFRTNLLTFLSQKFGTSGKLLGLLKILTNIKPTNDIANIIEILETLDTKEVPADEKSVLEKLRLYNGT